jgi:hypothetical protein
VICAVREARNFYKWGWTGDSQNSRRARIALRRTFAMIIEGQTGPLYEPDPDKLVWPGSNFFECFLSLDCNDLGLLQDDFVGRFQAAAFDKAWIPIIFFRVTFGTEPL